MKNIIIGADVSKRTIDCVLHDADKKKMFGVNHLKITNDRQGADELMKWLKQKKINKKDVFFCMEHTGDTIPTVSQSCWLKKVSASAKFIH